MSKTEEMTGAEMVVQALKDNGVDTIFGYPGGAVLPIYAFEILFLHCHEYINIYGLSQLVVRPGAFAVDLNGPGGLRVADVSLLARVVGRVQEQGGHAESHKVPERRGLVKIWIY